MDSLDAWIWWQQVAPVVECLILAVLVFLAIQSIRAVCMLASIDESLKQLPVVRAYDHADKRQNRARRHGARREAATASIHRD